MPGKAASAPSFDDAHLSGPAEAETLRVRVLPPHWRRALVVATAATIFLCVNQQFGLRFFVGFTPLMHAYVRSYDRLGNDPFIGRRLVSLLHNAGAAPRRNNWLFFGTCAGDPAFPAWMANILGIFNGARESIISAGLLIDPGLLVFTRNQSHASTQLCAYLLGVHLVTEQHIVAAAPDDGVAADIASNEIRVVGAFEPVVVNVTENRRHLRLHIALVYVLDG